MHDQKFEVDGVERSVRTIVPTSPITDRDGVPAVLVLHGSNNSIDLIDDLTALADKAETEGFVLVIPQGSIAGAKEAHGHGTSQASPR